MTLSEVYNQSLKKLQNPAIDEIAVRILLCEINSLKSMTDFYLKKNEEIQDLPRFNQYFERFLNGEPVQYILNKTTFFGIDLYVDNRVLIPRQESEEVVDFAIKKSKQLFGDKPLSICDVCCGSGAMGIALSQHLKTQQVIFSDISQDALDVCKKNIDSNSLFLCSDGIDELIKENLKVDVLISNPPYILKNECVDDSVLKFEPHLALFTNESFPVYEKIISKLSCIKKDQLLAVFEIGANTKPILEKMVKKYYQSCEYAFIKDMNGKERIFYLYLK